MKRWSEETKSIIALLLSILLVAAGISAYNEWQKGVWFPESPSWLSGWDYRKSHVINSATGAGTNYQVKITCHYGSGSDSGENVYLNSHSRTDFGDVRFTDNDGTTLLDFWMESKTDSDNAVFWVEVADDLSSSAVTIYVYYGKSGESSASNDDNTFLWADDCESGAATSKWEDGTMQPSYTTSSPIYQGLKSLTKASQAGNVDGLNPLTDGHDRCVVQYFYDPNTGNSINEIFTGTSLNDAWVSIVGVSSTDYTKYCYWDGTWHVSAIARSAGWHKVEFYFDGSGVDVYLDGTSIATGVGGNDLDTFRIYCSPANTAPRWDAFYIRKYVSPEPTHGSWGSEEQEEVVENSVTLNFPITGTQISLSVDFKFTPVFYQSIVNASVYTNETGSWALEETSYSVTNNTENTISHILLLSSEGTILWNVGVWNSTTEVFATLNATFTWDIPPRYQGVDSNATSIAENKTILLYGQGYDGIGLDWAWLATNETDVWKNYTSSLSFTKYSGNPVTDTKSIQPSVIKEGSEYWLYYDDSYNIYRRVGTNETNFGSATQVLSSGEYCFVWKDDSTYRMIYTHNDLINIRLATSATGTEFTDQGIIVSKSASDWDSVYVYDPCEIKVGSTYYVYYAGRNVAGASNGKIGLATSSSGNVGTYTKQGVVLEASYTFEGSFVADPEVREYKSGNYIMFYTGFDGLSVHRQSYATSTDLTTWNKYGSPIMWKTQDWEGTTTHNEPCIIIEDSKYKIWYRAGNPTCYIGYAWFEQNSSSLLPMIGYYYGSPADMNDVANIWTYANFTWSNSSISAGTQIQWRIYYNDTYGNVNGTSIHTFMVGTGLSVGWNDFNAFTVDVGHTLGEINASLTASNVNWTVVSKYNGTYHYDFYKDYHLNADIKILATSDVIYVYCLEAGVWTHEYS